MNQRFKPKVLQLNDLVPRSRCHHPLDSFPPHNCCKQCLRGPQHKCPGHFQGIPRCRGSESPRSYTSVLHCPFGLGNQNTSKMLIGLQFLGTIKTHILIPFGGDPFFGPRTLDLLRSKSPVVGLEDPGLAHGAAHRPLTDRFC